MNIAEADAFARHLLPQLGLRDWAVVWKAGRKWRTMAGRTQPAKKIIEMSRPIILVNDLDAVSEIVRHEAAHALVPFDGHNVIWRTIAERFGCKYVNAEGTIPMRLPSAHGVAMGEVRV